MLAGVINLRSLVASKAWLNAALRRQHSRVVNNEVRSSQTKVRTSLPLMDFLILWKAYSSPERIISGLPVIGPGHPMVAVLWKLWATRQGRATTRA